MDSVIYRVDAQRDFQQVLVASVDDKIIVADLDGEILIEHTRPAPGLKYVGDGTSGRGNGRYILRRATYRVPEPKTRRPPALEIEAITGRPYRPNSTPGPLLQQVIRVVEHTGAFPVLHRPERTQHVDTAIG